MINPSASRAHRRRCFFSLNRGITIDKWLLVAVKKETEMTRLSDNLQSRNIMQLQPCPSQPSVQRVQQSTSQPQYTLSMLELDILLQKKLPALNREYIRGLNRDLAKQNSRNLLGRNVLAAQRQLLADLKREIPDSDYCPDQLRVVLSKQAQAFVESALKHNRSSCAISNFPEERSPSPVYIGDVLAQCEALFKKFVSRL